MAEAEIKWLKVYVKGDDLRSIPDKRGFCNQFDLNYAGIGVNGRKYLKAVTKTPKGKINYEALSERMRSEYQQVESIEPL